MSRQLSIERATPNQEIKLEKPKSLLWLCIDHTKLNERMTLLWFTCVWPQESKLKALYGALTVMPIYMIYCVISMTLDSEITQMPPSLKGWMTRQIFLAYQNQCVSKPT